MPNYVFHFENGLPEDLVLDLPDDTTAAEEGFRTASGMMSDLSLPPIGKEFYSLEVRQESGEQVLKVEVNIIRSDKSPQKPDI